MIDGGQAGSECPHDECRRRLVPSNSAANFVNPALAVVRGVERRVLDAGKSVLEFGAGNLRNALYVLSSVPGVRYYAFEIPQTVARFSDHYAQFREAGGHLLDEAYLDHEFDCVICTFVLETICPESRRLHCLFSLAAVLGEKGALVASFRGHTGVRGTTYDECPAGEGFVTANRTFVRPHSVSEVNELLCEGGFGSVELLQKYRVDRPENIHVLARVGREV